MKKFLFTLATLLMAGSMFAANENYFYLDNITLTKDEAAAGCKKVVAVKGHFDEAVSAWQVKFTLPEGVTIDMAAQGPDMTLTYQNQFTDPETLDAYYAEATYTPNLSPNADKTMFIVSVMDTKEYDPSTGKSYGICWRPGDYDVMWRVRLVFPAGFKGGDIVLNTQQSCGQSIMPGLTGCTLNPIDKTTEVRIKADKPEIAVTGDDYTKTVTITAEEDATIYYSTDGVSYQVYTAPIEFNEEGTYKVYAYAEGPGEGVERKSKSDVAESNEFTIIEQEQQEPAPAATISNEGNVVTAAVAGHTVELYIVTKDGEGNEVLTEVPNPYTVEQTFSEQKITFKALTKANEGESEDTWSEPKEITIDAKPDNQCPQPEFAYYQTPDNELWARVMYYGEAPYTEHVELYIVTTNDEGEEVLTPVDNPYKDLPTENNTFEDIVVKFKAIVKADGVNYNVDNYDYYTVTIPGKEDKQAPAPTFRVEGDKLYAEQGGLTVELYKKNDDGTWTKVDNPYEGLPTENTSYTEPIKIDFKAITLADGVTYNVNSDEATYTYELAPLNKKTAEKPTIAGANLTETTYDIVITPDPATDGALDYNVDVEGTVVRAGATTIRYERKDADYYVAVTAKTLEGPTYKASELAEASIKIPAKDAPKVYEVADPTITVDNSDPTKTVITIEATEGNLTYTLTEDDEPFTDYTVEVVDGKVVITIENGEEVKTVDVTATTTLTSVPEGFDSVENGYAEQTVQTPVYVQPQTAKPTIDVSFAGEEGHYYANVTFKNGEADPNAVIEYCLSDPTVEDNWMTYTGAPVVITEDGTTRVYARATADGKATSEEVYRDVNLNQTATSVNELVNGKTVAGVRYFNMAGQEMQEANGITIVVTTYTDGTTSAVKVIK